MKKTESQVSLSSSTHKNEAPVNKENGYSDQFGLFRTTNTTVSGIQQSRDFLILANSNMQSGKTRVTGSGTTLGELEVEYKETSKQRRTARVSTITKLPGTNKVTPTLETSLMDNGASMEEALTRIVDSLGEHNEQISIRMSDLERAVNVERESLREEINRNRQRASKNEKSLKERTDKYWGG